MESQGLLSGVETPKSTSYTKVIGALATGAVIVCGTSGYFSSSTQAGLDDARFEFIEADHTLDGTANDNVTCICDTGYEADPSGNECQEIDPCTDPSTNNCEWGTCEDWDPPAEYDPGYQCNCWWGYGNTNNLQECEPLPCPTLTINHTIDCIEVSGALTNTDKACVCEDGYGPDSTFTMDCTPTGPGAPSWTNEKECLPIPCPSLNVANSNYEAVDTELVTLESTTVTCDDGYELSPGSGCTFEAVCTAAVGPNSHWLLASGEALPACVPVACDTVLIDHSTANGDQSGLVTGDSLDVSCDSGYEDLATGAFAFTMTCGPESCDDNSWSGAQPCEPSFCGALNIANSQEGTATDYLDHVESETRHVTCADGFEPTVDSTGSCTVAYDCNPVAPGNAEYVGSATCDRVVCEDYEADFVAGSAQSYNLDGTQQQTDTCIDGYGTAANGGNGDYTVECVPNGPCERVWDHQPACEPIECGDLSSAFSNYTTATFTGSVTGEAVSVACADGYETSTGACSYEATCTGDAPNSNYWHHADTCQLVACHDDIDIPFSTSSVTTEVTFDETTVTCINGYWDAGTSTGSFDLSCAPIPCDNEWTGYKDCTPTPCPPLTVANSDTTEEDTGADITDPVRTARCQDGYEPDVDAGGCTVARTCDTDAPAVSFWTGEDISCSPKPCDDAILDALDRNTLTSSDGFDAVLTCDDGFARDGAGSFTSECQALAPCSVDWNNQDNCVCVECPSDTFSHSNHETAGISGCTEQSDTVACHDGYCASGSATFTATCTGTAPAEVEWTGLDTCEPSSCGALNIANSDTTGNWEGVTGDWREVSCDPGCHSNDCTSIIITCHAVSPCLSEYDHPDFQCVCDDV